MVISMQAAVMVPEGQHGTGGYCEQDTFLITEKGNRNLSGFPFGAERLIITPAKKSVRT
jgi:creatinase